MESASRTPPRFRRGSGSSPLARTRRVPPRRSFGASSPSSWLRARTHPVRRRPSAKRSVARPPPPTGSTLRRAREGAGDRERADERCGDSASAPAGHGLLLPLNRPNSMGSSEARRAVVTRRPRARRRLCNGGDTGSTPRDIDRQRDVECVVEGQARPSLAQGAVLRLADKASRLCFESASWSWRSNGLNSAPIRVSSAPAAPTSVAARSPSRRRAAAAASP